MSSQNTEEKGESDDSSDASKSEISLVYEIALKRNLCVNFEVRTDLIINTEENCAFWKNNTWLYCSCFPCCPQYCFLHHVTCTIIEQTWPNNIKYAFWYLVCFRNYLWLHSEDQQNVAR